VTTIHELFAQLSVPAIAAPMTSVSTPELVIAACNAGIVGAFPASNCRSSAELDEWLDRIERETASSGGRGTLPQPGPLAVNLIVHPSNARLDADLDQLVGRGVRFVITSVGSPKPVVDPLHRSGCAVLADVASLAHAHKALDTGVDGLVLLSAGAGGHTGWANPLAFARAVRAFYDGPLVLAGGVSDGTALWAANVCGYDLGYLGTKLIATPESGASPEWRQAVVDATLDDIVLGTSPTGIAASLLPPAGSGGHTVSGVDAVRSAAEVIGQVAHEWRVARARTRAVLDSASPVV
jgi:nitronate monooxygenase